MLLDDEAPAGAVRCAARGGVGAPYGIDERPLNERCERHCDDERERDGKKLAQRNATRALCQFMNAEIDRLTVRYTAMMMATPSIAWPVWLMVVLAMDTRSG